MSSIKGILARLMKYDGKYLAAIHWNFWKDNNSNSPLNADEIEDYYKEAKNHDR